MVDNIKNTEEDNELPDSIKVLLSEHGREFIEDRLKEDDYFIEGDIK